MESIFLENFDTARQLVTSSNFDRLLSFVYKFEHNYIVPNATILQTSSFVLNRNSSSIEKKRLLKKLQSDLMSIDFEVLDDIPASLPVLISSVTSLFIEDNV